MIKESVRLAVVGTGRWGVNLVRALGRVEAAELVSLCDLSVGALAKSSPLAPRARRVTDYDAVLEDPTVEAIMIATPAASHASLALQALAAGKHVFVEKPLALTLRDALAVTQAAERVDRTLMVGHLMIHHPSVRLLKELVDKGALGPLARTCASRRNPPSEYQDTSALWALAPHDVSLALYLMGEEPVAVNACAFSGGCLDATDGAELTLQFRSVSSRIEVSRVHTHKERRTTVVGSRSVVVFDDTRPQNKLAFLDAGGPAPIPERAEEEPLVLECAHFVSSITNGTAPDTDGRSALDVIRVLDAAERSIRAGGATVRLASTPAHVTEQARRASGL